MLADKISACVRPLTVIYGQNKQQSSQVLNIQVSGKTKRKGPSSALVDISASIHEIWGGREVKHGQICLKGIISDEVSE